MYINSRRIECHEPTKTSYCGDINYIISGRLPEEYNNKTVLELAGLYDHLNPPIFFNHGFKFTNKDYTISFLVHAYKEKDQFVDVLSIDKLTPLVRNFDDGKEWLDNLPDWVECMYVYFIGDKSSISEGTNLLN
ncbi:hypothetical protein NOVO_00105 [Rickettsiales bacterium Ac37b]|nr:hypothetical protein NOVO_00105 [Rickettsiales bacterium Ac37b]